MKVPTAIVVMLSALASLQSGPPATATPVPGARAHHALVYDAAQARVLLIGGSTPINDGASYEFFDDIWAFDGRRWTNLGPTGSRRSGRAVAYDSKRRRVLSFGGYCSCPDVAQSRFADFLELNGVTWKALESGANGSRADARLIYDTRRDRVVLYGGAAPEQQGHGDMMEFDGTAWLPSAARGFEPRRGFAMVYDERRSQTVLFGGSLVSTPGVLGETWLYDGSSWTRASGTGPSPRHNAGLAYDSKRGRVILFGGGSPEGVLQDTWAWDGARWTKLAENGPPARVMPALAYDTARDRVVLFGGRVGFPNDLNDTWEWDGERWREWSGAAPAATDAPPLFGRLDPGRYAVGFRVAEVRAGAPNAESTVPIGLWYPAAGASGSAMTYGDYVTSPAYGGLQPDARLENFAGRLASWHGWTPGGVGPLFPAGVTPARFNQMMSTAMHARRQTPEAAGQFPALVMATDQVMVNPVLGEYLASHGVIVATYPDVRSRGAVAAPDVPVRREGDLAAVLAHVRQLPSASSRIVLHVGASATAVSVARVAAGDAITGVIFHGGAPPVVADPAVFTQPVLEIGLSDEGSERRVGWDALIARLRGSDRISLAIDATHPELLAASRLAYPQHAARQVAFDIVARAVLAFVRTPGIDSVREAVAAAGAPPGTASVRGMLREFD